MMLTRIVEILKQAVARDEIRTDVDLDATARTVNTMMIAVGDARLFLYLNKYFQGHNKFMTYERVVDSMNEMMLGAIHKRS